nr:MULTISPECIES: hypothetical protein [unclassified Anabaena]
MLQKVSNHLIIPEPSEDLIVNEPWSIEFYADGLMDELFADIDEILDLSGNLLDNNSRRKLRQATPVANDLSYSAGTEQRTLEYEPLQTVDIQQIVSSTTVNHPVKTVTAIQNKQVSAVVVDQPQIKAISKTTEKAQLTLGKLLLLGTTIGVAIAGVLYLLQSQLLALLTSQLIQPTQPNIHLPSAQVATKPDAQTELVNYMMGALAIIDQQNRATNQSVRSQVGNNVNSSSSAVALNNNQPVSNLPSPLTASNTPPTPSKTTNVVERIYIPVYQAPSPMRYAPPSIPGMPAPLPPVAKSPTAEPNTVKNNSNQVPAGAKPAKVNMSASSIRSEMKPVPVQNAPIKVQQSPSSLPKLPVIPFGQTLPQSPTNTNQATVPVTTLTVTPPTPASTHTLEGLLELGDKSVALFEINGVSRRIHIGESIGSSGWTLVDVSNGEAIVRRNGEVRSIFAGQKL